MLSRRSLLAAGFWSLAGAPLACWSDREREGSEATGRFERPKNCLLVVLDAATAGHFHAWGYERETTPNLDRLAGEGVRFQRAFSQASATVPSVRSYLTGTYPNDIRAQLLASEFTLADAFRQAGFKTALFSENPYISNTFGYDKGFDYDRAYFSLRALHTSKRSRQDVELDSEQLHADVRSWISAVGRSPWFCYIHQLRPHAPYIAPPPFSNRYTGAYQGRANGSAHTLRKLERSATPEEAAHFADLYDGNLSYCDDLIGGLLEWLEDSGRSEETLIIVASDHGEAFMQHGFLQHGTTVYDEMIHVPLIFKFPEAAGIANGVVDAQVELLDLFPTLASVYQFPASPHLHGRSLAPLMTRTADSHKDHVFSLSLRGGSMSFALRSAENKYLIKLDPSDRTIASHERYDLSNDPGETRNLLAPGAVDTRSEALLTARFPWLLGKAGAARHEELAPKDVDAETHDALEALGYIR